MKVLNTKISGNLKLQLYLFHKNVRFYYKEAFLLGKEIKMVVDSQLGICQVFGHFISWLLFSFPLRRGRIKAVNS